MTRVLREIGLSAAALVGVVVLVGWLAMAVFDVRALVFRSGSMAPTVNTGDLGISRLEPAADIERGDVVTVVAASGARVTHRALDVTPDGPGRVALALQGDANHTPDPETYVVSEAPVLLFSVPKAGYVLDWLSGTMGLPLLGGYAVLMGYLLLRRSPGARAAPDARGHARC